MADPDGPVVVKLGGSLLRDEALDELLRAILETQRRVVIVPGGGPFADVVREVQQLVRFSDTLAHRLAIRAMGTFTDILCERYAQLVSAPTRPAIDAAWRVGLKPVWDASEVIGHPEIPECWEVTSDSLAAWLAGAIDAHALILVKSASLRPGASLHDLVSGGVVDQAFLYFSAQLSGSTIYVGRQDWMRLGDIIDSAASRTTLGLAIRSTGPA